MTTLQTDVGQPQQPDHQYYANGGDPNYMGTVDDTLDNIGDEFDNYNDLQFDTPDSDPATTPALIQDWMRQNRKLAVIAASSLAVTTCAVIAVSYFTSNTTDETQQGSQLSLMTAEPYIDFGAKGRPQAVAYTPPKPAKTVAPKPALPMAPPKPVVTPKPKPEPVNTYRPAPVHKPYRPSRPKPVQPAPPIQSKPIDQQSGIAVADGGYMSKPAVAVHPDGSLTDFRWTTVNGIPVPVMVPTVAEDGEFTMCIPPFVGANITGIDLGQYDIPVCDMSQR